MAIAALASVPAPPETKPSLSAGILETTAVATPTASEDANTEKVVEKTPTAVTMAAGSVNPPLTPKGGGGVFKNAAQGVLRMERRLMSTGEITRLAMKLGLIGSLPGKTPDATMASALYTDIKKGRIGKGDSLFARPCEGLFGLKEWADDAELADLLVERSKADNLQRLQRSEKEPAAANAAKRPSTPPPQSPRLKTENAGKSKNAEKSKQVSAKKLAEQRDMDKTTEDAIDTAADEERAASQKQAASQQDQSPASRSQKQRATGKGAADKAANEESAASHKQVVQEQAQTQRTAGKGATEKSANEERTASQKHAGPGHDQALAPHPQKQRTTGTKRKAKSLMSDETGGLQLLLEAAERLSNEEPDVEPDEEVSGATHPCPPPKRQRPAAIEIPSTSMQTHVGPNTPQGYSPSPLSAARQQQHEFSDRPAEPCPARTDTEDLICVRKRITRLYEDAGPHSPLLVRAMVEYAHLCHVRGLRAEADLAVNKSWELYQCIVAGWGSTVTLLDMRAAFERLLEEVALSYHHITALQEA